MRQHIPLQIDTWRNFCQLQTAFAQAKDSALGDENHVLLPQGGIVAVKGDLLDLVNELAGFALLHTGEPALPPP